MTTPDQHVEIARRFRNNQATIDADRQERMRPVALEMIAQHEASNRQLFEGLMYHYTECVCTGRLDLWAKAAHAAVDLMASDRAPFVKRSELYSQ